MVLKGQGFEVTSLMAILVFVIIGVAAAIPVVKDQVVTATTGNATVVNESSTPTSVNFVEPFNVVGSGVTSVTFVANQTFTIPAANYTFNATHLTYALAADANATGVPYNITYVYEPAAYVRDAAARQMLNIIVLFVVIFIVLVIARQVGLL